MLGPLKLRLLTMVKLMSPKTSLSSTINGNSGMTYLLDLIENKIDFSDLTDLRILSIKNSPLHLENMNIVIRYWHEGQTAYRVSGVPVALVGALFSCQPYFLLLTFLCKATLVCIV